MSGLLVAVSELGERIESRYLHGDPVELTLTGHHPDFEVDRADPLEIHEYVSGSPSLIGRYPVRAIAIVEDEVVSIFDGSGYYINRTFGIRNTVSGLNGLFHRAGLSYTVREVR